MGPHSMKRAVLILVACVVVLLAGALAVPFFIDANQFRPRLEAELSKALGREVKLGDLKVSLLAGGVSAADLSIADDAAFSHGPFFRAKALNIHVELQPLIVSRKLIVTGIEIDGPEIELIQSNAGAWNFSSLGNHAAPKESAQGGGGAPELTVKLVKISNGRISLKTPGDAPKTLEKLNIEVKDFSAVASFPFAASAGIRGGGDVNVSGKAGPIHAQDASETPFDASLKLNQLDVAKTGFVRPTTAFEGLLSVDGTVASTGKDLALKGTIQVQRLKLAKRGKPATKPVGFDFALTHDMKKRATALQRGEVHIGNAKAQLAGAYRSEGANNIVNLKLAAPSMAIDELTAMLPALDIVLPRGSSLQGGTATVNVTVAGPTNKLVSAGSLAVQKTRLAGFDLGSRMNTVAQLTGIKISPDTDFDNLSANIRADPAGVHIDAISVIAPTIGDLNGAGTVSPANALDFKMTAKLHTGGVLNIVNPAGQTVVPFFIQGTSAEPKFVPDVKGMVGAVAADRLKPLTNTDMGKAATGIIDLFKRKKQN
jgi:AsmA protein